MGLFCTKKPPKSSDNDNEIIHHQRAHKKNIRKTSSIFSVSQRKEMNLKFYLKYQWTTTLTSVPQQVLG